jgi:hypothetical protein
MRRTLGPHFSQTFQDELRGDGLPASLVKSRRQPIPGLKGQNIPAQGNALGLEKRSPISPERAKQMVEANSFVTPFQGWADFRCLYPGRCPALYPHF